MAVAKGKGKGRAKGKGKSGTAKTAPKAASDNGAGKRAAQREADAKLIEQIKELRAQDKTHADIAKKLNIQATKALFLDIVGQVKPGERIKEGDLDAALVKKLRGDGLAWHTISARCYAGGHPVGIPVIKGLAEEAGVKTSGRLASSNGSAKKPSARRGKGKGKGKGGSRPRSNA